MRQLAPGLIHWTARHPRIGSDVSSYYLADARVLIDPMEPAEGLGAVAEHGEPERILLTNRHHYRHSARFVEAFGCAVRCHRLGLHEFRRGEAVEPFEFGDEPAPGVVAHEVGAICPEETALHLRGPGALAFADALVRAGDGPLEFVPDWLLGDDPEGVRAGLVEAFRRLLALPFDHVLLAHGAPLVGAGREALERFVAAPRSARW